MIRKAQKEDWPAIKAIYTEGINTENATFELAENIAPYETWLKSKVPNSVLVFGKEKVEGWAALSKVSDRCVYAGVAEVSVYVSLEANGNGIGSALMQELITFVEQNNIWTMQAGIFPENTGSIALHKKFGFREVGIREKLGKLNGKWRDVLLMERRSSEII